MGFIKLKFFRSREFKLFISVWLVYVFYLQMYGMSGMANSQSALTAAIVNEGRFEIDTYYRVGGGGVAFYDDHYYSGQAPGISVVSVPLYILSKPVIHFLPQGATDFLFEKLERYGEKLPVDYYGNQKVLSNYFPGLSKRDILEYILISGFILPVFTTSLISALCVVIFYLALKKITNNGKLRMLITLFYAFGTYMFPLSTEFFERPIAIALMFSAFIIIFKIRHKELRAERSSLFAAGILAGLSAWFDYFHIAIAGMLFLYLLFFYIKDNTKSNKSIRSVIFGLNKKRLVSSSYYIIGVVIPVILLFLYYYIIFDNPFTQSYAYSIIPESVHKISGILNIQMPDLKTLGYMAGFFIFSPTVILTLYGVYKAILKKDAYLNDALAVGFYSVVILLYASILSFSYPSAIAPSFSRYMTPILPFTFLFMPYIFTNRKMELKNTKALLLIAIGVISIFMNWSSAQYGGHHALGQYDFENNRFMAGADFLLEGPSSSLLSTLSGVLGVNSLLLNVLGLAMLVLLLVIIWRNR